MGEERKTKKYQELLDRFIFIPFAVETLGPLGDVAKRQISEIISKIPEKRARSFIIQRIGIAVQKGDAASVLGTIGDESGLDEIFDI